MLGRYQPIRRTRTDETSVEKRKKSSLRGSHSFLFRGQRQRITKGGVWHASAPQRVFMPEASDAAQISNGGMANRVHIRWGRRERDHDSVAFGHGNADTVPYSV